MKAKLRIFLLGSLLAGFVSFAFLSTTKLLSATEVSPAITEDLPLHLNGEPVGSVANTQPLEERLRSLEEKLPNANLPGGALPNIGRIVIVPDDRISMADLAQIWGKIEDFFDTPPYDWMALLAPTACENKAGGRTANGDSTFILSNSPMSVDDLLKVRTGTNCKLATSLFPADPTKPYSKLLLKSYRTAVTSLEITATGSYLMNEQAKNPQHRASPIANLESVKFRRKIDAANVKQRPIDAKSLEKELESWFARRVAEGSKDLQWNESGSIVLPIIINAGTPYAALAKIFRSVAGTKVRLEIVVNGAASRY